MARIQIGVAAPEELDYGKLGDFARKVEELGFDSLWTTENLSNNAPCLEPLTALAFMAAHTSRVLLGTDVLLLPLRNPLLIAQTVTFLDRVSGGRVILGLGAGGDDERKMVAFGGSLRERGGRSEEGVEILKRIWTESSVSFQGRYNSIQDYTLLPRPVQQPHPPVWLGGRADAVLRRTARWADGFISVFVTPQTAAPLFDRIDEYAQEYGRGPGSITRAVHLYISLADNPEEAARIHSEVISGRYGHPTSRSPDRASLFGTPEQCRELIQEFADIGVTHFVIDPTCHPDQILAQLEVFSEEILPHFRTA